MQKLNKLLLPYLFLLIGGGSVAAAQDSAFEFDWQPPAFSAKTAQATTFEYPGDLQGPTIVLFWATWCPYCKALMPHLQSIVDEYGDGVRVLALNFREDGDPVSYIARAGYQFMLFPEADAVAESWGIKGTPGLFLADKSGRVVFSRGAIPKAAYPAVRFADNDTLKGSQKAARAAPFWAARLRESMDQLAARSE